LRVVTASDKDLAEKRKERESERNVATVEWRKSPDEAYLTIPRKVDSAEWLAWLTYVKPSSTSAIERSRMAYRRQSHSPIASRKPKAPSRGSQRIDDRPSRAAFDD